MAVKITSVVVVDDGGLPLILLHVLTKLLFIVIGHIYFVCLVKWCEDSGRPLK